MTPEHLSCQELVEVVTDYLEGRLPDEETARVEAHLSLCPPCVHYIEQIRLLLRLGAQERDRELPALVEQLLPAFRSFRRRAHLTPPRMPGRVARWRARSSPRPSSRSRSCGPVWSRARG